MIRRRKLLLGMSALGLLVSAGQSRGEVDFSKLFFQSDVAGTADIIAGGQLASHFNSPVTVHTYKVAPDLVVKLNECKLPADGSPKNVGLGLEIGDTHTTLDDTYDTGLVKYDDSHDASNHAEGRILVVPASFPNGVKVRSAGGIPTNTTVKPGAMAFLIGSATAGVPTKEDGHDKHSASVVLGAKMTGGTVFKVIPGEKLELQYLTENRILSRGTAFSGGKSQLWDPVVMTLRNLTTGTSRTDVLTTFNMDAQDAEFSIDDTGISFLINPGDPESYVDMQFSNAGSPWLTNPYSYAAHFDPSGLTASGATPLSGWSISTVGTQLRAFWSFDADGLPFDMANISIPMDDLVSGDDYAIDFGGDGGVSEIVPEPGTLAILGVSGMLLLGRGRTGFRRPGRIRSRRGAPGS
jgi:hypothetical protein